MQSEQKYWRISTQYIQFRICTNLKQIENVGHEILQKLLRTRQQEERFPSP